MLKKQEESWYKYIWEDAKSGRIRPWFSINNEKDRLELTLTTASLDKLNFKVISSKKCSSDN